MGGWISTPRKAAREDVRTWRNSRLPPNDRILDAFLPFIASNLKVALGSIALKNP
jgi:hypothetical protein